MTSISSVSYYKNLSLCVYIGNTISIGDKTLFNYCSQFGTIISSSFEKEKFCDFHIIEFIDSEQLERFLNIQIHEINRIILDVKLYKHILTNNDILNIDRKFFIGPILDSKDENLIVKFYKTIDPTLQYCLSEQDNQIYLLFEFNNRQTIKTIFERQTIPITIEHRKFLLYKPMHPKQFVNKIISMKNKQNQIYIHGLTDHITETMLIEYFHKRAPVIACHILSDDRKCAIMEFNDKQTVKKILDTPNIRLQGINLSLTKASRHLTSLLSSVDNKDESDDEVKISHPEPILNSLPIQNQSSLFILPTIQLENIQQSFVNPTPPPVYMEPILILPPDTNESGWSSPPRTVVTHSPSIDQPSIRLSSKPCSTTNSINTDLTNRLTTIEADIKPIRSSSSNNILRFVEQFQNDLDQIKDEYRLKFDKDQKYIEQEINLLINEERDTFDKLNRYLTDHRRRVEKHNHNNNNKRKCSPSSSTH